MSTPADEPATSARHAAERSAQEAYARLLALVSIRTRDITAAEDALGDAFVAALQHWPTDGVPDQQDAWLLTAARRRLVDGQRRDARSVRVLDAFALVNGADSARSDISRTAAPTGLIDERLQMLALCAHPALDASVRTPLMLQLVLGLDAAAIAPAFLMSPAAMSQRLVRAKAKIRDTAIDFALPEGDALDERLVSVLDAMYAAYGLAWDDLHGASSGTRGLGDEAIRLARLLCGWLPREPEAHGLLALMLYCEARRGARRDGDAFVPLSAQDPARWSALMLAEAERALNTAATMGRIGRFQLEAAIQSGHIDRTRSGVANWPAIVALYNALVHLAPTLGALVARAAAVAEASGPQSGLERLDALDEQVTRGYQPYWALRAHVLDRLGRAGEADEARQRAVGLSDDPAVRAFLLRRTTP